MGGRGLARRLQGAFHLQPPAGGGRRARFQAQDGFPVLGAMICKMELKSKQIESKCKGMLRLEGEANSREENPGEASREKSNLEQPNPPPVGSQL